MASLQGTPLEFYVLADGTLAKDEYWAGVSYITSVGVVGSVYTITFKTTSRYLKKIVFAQVWNNGTAATVALTGANTMTVTLGAAGPFILQVYYQAQP